jgi:hypothetical protein
LWASVQKEHLVTSSLHTSFFTSLSLTSWDRESTDGTVNELFSELCTTPTSVNQWHQSSASLVLGHCSDRQYSSVETVIELIA